MSSKKLKTTSICNESKRSVNTPKSAAVREVSALAEESTFYDNDAAIIELTQPAYANEDVEEIQKEFTVYGDRCDVDIQNESVSTTRKRATSKTPLRSEFEAAEPIEAGFGDDDNEPVAKKSRKQGRGGGAHKQTESKPVKSIDAAKLRVYDFDAGNEKPVVKKSSGRGRGRSHPRKMAQPKKRVKNPLVNQREIIYTVFSKKPFGKSAKTFNAAKIVHKNSNGIDEFAITSAKTRANSIVEDQSSTRTNFRYC